MVSRADVATYRMTTEERRRYAAKASNTLSAHILAKSLLTKLVERNILGGDTPRHARTLALRELQQTAGYADPRSVRNLLQPGGRRGVSERVRTAWENLLHRLGGELMNPSSPQTPSKPKFPKFADFIHNLVKGIVVEGSNATIPTEFVGVTWLGLSNYTPKRGKVRE